MVLLIDNYDSFSYNLYQLIGSVTPDIKVIRNDELTVKEIEDLKPSHIILSPGPGKPHDAGVCEDVVKELGGSIPILGVCLGHQAICEVYGATVTYAKRLMHGKQSVCTISDDVDIFEGIDDVDIFEGIDDVDIFEGIDDVEISKDTKQEIKNKNIIENDDAKKKKTSQENELTASKSARKINVARYHSLAARKDTIPESLQVIATSDDDGEVMAVKHVSYPVYGLQFHPESILTPSGIKILKNFIER